MLVLVLVFRSSPFLLRQEASAERTAAVKGARGYGAAQRILEGEERSGKLA
jgi:hypothetical protein